MMYVTNLTLILNHFLEYGLINTAKNHEQQPARPSVRANAGASQRDPMDLVEQERNL